MLGQREYDPQYGRFLNRDPIDYGGGINLYACVGGNPINVYDPSGLDGWKIFGCEFTPGIVLEGVKTGLAASANVFTFGRYRNRYYENQPGYSTSQVLATISREAALTALQTKAFEAVGAGVKAYRVSRAARAAGAGLTGMARVRWMGQVGEAAAGIVRNFEHISLPGWRSYRVPDVLNEGSGLSARLRT